MKRGAKTSSPEWGRGMFGEDEIHSDYQKEFKKKIKKKLPRYDS